MYKGNIDKFRCEVSKVTNFTFYILEFIISYIKNDTAKREKMSERSIFFILFKNSEIKLKKSNQ